MAGTHLNVDESEVLRSTLQNEKGLRGMIAKFTANPIWTGSEIPRTSEFS